MLQIKGTVPSRPMKQPLRVRDLVLGQLAVIVEAGEYFGFHVLMTKANDGSGDWAVCLNDATITCKVRNCLCRLVQPPDKITLMNE